MSNLPVLWIPPIEPPSPDDRPPVPRRSRGRLLAAVAVLVVPLSAWALIGGGNRSGAPGPVTSGGSQPYLTTDGKAPLKPDTLPTPTQTSPTTTAPVAASPSTEAPAASATSRTPSPTEAPSATTATARPASPEGSSEGQGVRVIDMNKPNGGGHAIARPAVSLPDTAQAPTTRRPAAATSQPVTSQPASPPPASSSTASAPPASPSASSTEASAPIAPPRDQTTERKAATRQPSVTAPAGAAASSAGASDFADRLATMRRSEEGTPRVLGAPPRYLEVPPSVDDEEDTRVVTPSLPRDERYDRPKYRRDSDSNWDDEGPLPPAGIPGDDPAPRRTLRPYDTPDRIVRSGTPRGENCHYHAYPADDMPFHREVRCHWHEDPNDPSIHYTR